MKTSKENLESVVPKSAVASPAEMEALLGMSEERKAQAQAEQEQLRKAFNSRGKLSRQNLLKARGAELMQTALASGNLDAYAEALAMQGMFEQAARVTRRPDLKREYIAKHVAVSQADDDCECDNFRTENGYKLPNQYVESYGWSEKHGKTMPFVRCTVCDNLNAKPLPDYLQRQRELRARSLAGERITAEELFKAR